MIFAGRSWRLFQQLLPVELSAPLGECAFLRRPAALRIIAISFVKGGFVFDFIWNMFQDRDIDRVGSALASQRAQFEASRKQASSMESRLLELEMRHEQLKLTTLALWRLLQDRSGLTESDLRKHVESTDLQDGRADGRAVLLKGMVKCGGCRHFLLNTAIVCPYCGARNAGSDPFETA